MNSKTRRLLDAYSERIEDLEDEQNQLIVESRFYRSRNLPWAEETEKRLAFVRSELDDTYGRFSDLHRHYAR